MVSTEKLISAAHAVHIANAAMNSGERPRLAGIGNNSVHLFFRDFCERFPDRSAWSFEPWPDYPEYVGKHSITIDGVEFYALEDKEENEND